MCHLTLTKWRLVHSAKPHALRPCLSSGGITKIGYTKRNARTAISGTAVHLDTDVESEPLERYRQGGYHPTHLGDLLKAGRYQVKHKLGWGGYGTVWLAMDRTLSRCVAIKILVAEAFHTTQEADLLEEVSLGPADHPGKEHIVQLLDNFEHEGPNGTHPCLVLELLGSSVATRAEAYKSFRLPGALAWEISKQTLQALAYIHDNGIVYGGKIQLIFSKWKDSRSLQPQILVLTRSDLHSRNIAFTTTIPAHQNGEDVLSSLEKPRRGNVIAMSGQSFRHLPSYIVEPTSLALADPGPKSCHVKIIDFGEASLPGQQRQRNTPLIFRPPEYLFESQWDFQSDIWTLGCTLFELIIGYPPFDNILPDRNGLIRNWISLLGDLPEEWRNFTPHPEIEEEQIALKDWLRETYFDEGKTPYFSEADIDRAGTMLRSILQYRSSDRPQLSELLDYS